MKRETEKNPSKMALAASTLKRYCNELPASDEWHGVLKNWRDGLSYSNSNHRLLVPRAMGNDAKDWPALRRIGRALYRALADNETYVAINTMNFIVEVHQKRILMPPRSKQVAVLNEVPQPLADFKKCPDETADRYCLVVPDNRLAEFGVFKDDELSCSNRPPQDRDAILMVLDDELFLGYLHLSSGTPERFTVCPIPWGDKIILPARHLSDVLTIVNGVYAQCLESIRDDGSYLWLVDLRKTSNSAP